MASERGRTGSLAMQHRVNGGVKRNNDFIERGGGDGSSSSCRSGTNNKGFFLA